MMSLNKNLSTQALKEDFRVHNKISMKKHEGFEFEHMCINSSAWAVIWPTLEIWIEDMKEFDQGTCLKH
jgi:hypothetical protein